MRAVLDANVLISAVIARGAPAEALAACRSGRFELIVSDALLDELARTLARPKLSRRIPAAEVAAFVDLIRRAGTLVPDPPSPPRRSTDPGDDYLVVLAESSGAALVTGDHHLLALSNELPVRAPRQFLAMLD